MTEVPGFGFHSPPRGTNKPGPKSVSSFESSLDPGDSASGNIAEKPRFADEDRWDFHLVPPSPGIGQGTQPMATSDLDGNPIEAPFNIGPYDQPK